MDTEFIVFFDYVKQDKVFPNAEKASQALYEYLIERMQLYKKDCQQDIDEAYKNNNVDYLSILHFPANGDPAKNCSRQYIEYNLKRDAGIDLYLNSSRIGIFETANAISRQLFESNMSIPIKPEKNIADVKEAIEIDNAIKLLSQHDGNHIETITPLSFIKLIYAFETRLFSIRLRKFINESQIDLNALDQLTGFVSGTSEKLLQSVSPMRPSKSMVECLAKVLHVTPNRLWVDLLKHYLDTSNSWNEMDSHAS